MRHLVVLSLLSLALTGCEHAAKFDDAFKPHPFVGCWQDDTGLSRETWGIDTHGLIFGSAETKDLDGNVTFSERMFFNRSGKLDVLEVTTERDDGLFADEVSFIRRKTTNPNEYRFENPDHDYPQVIVYKRNGDALNAYIDLMAGGKKVSFDKRKCKGD